MSIDCLHSTPSKRLSRFQNGNRKCVAVSGKLYFQPETGSYKLGLAYYVSMHYENMSVQYEAISKGGKMIFSDVKM